ncbi:adenylate/guanylate cyclase domain-containing protein [Baaleninema sp.]|uniref:adenylate/guanylate cyclase domain-containing protein n=1 Tax=Baaleninema sp. TaxID=3101197 RepID=UPI003D06E40D
MFDPFFNRESDILETRLHGTRCSAFLSELLTNSGHFLVLNSLSEIALMGWDEYLWQPGHYIILAAMLTQAAYLSRAKAHRFWGNLIGAGMYTLVELPLEGLEFFQEPNHIVLGIFAITIASLQGLRFHWATRVERWIVPLESLTRMGMFIALYVVLKLKSQDLPMTWDNVRNFSHIPHHQFLVEALLFTGLLVGMQSLQVLLQRRKLQETAATLRNLAEWGMGAHAVKTAMFDPQQLGFQRRERAIVFMDVRGFTPWCESITPDEVATVLNRYYRAVEPAAARFQPLRIALTGDEVMAIYATAQQAVNAAVAMQNAARSLLADYKLGAGCAVHYGPAIEGLFGGEDVRTYTAIGDVVNTAKRLEGATPAHEISLSDAVYRALDCQSAIEVAPRPPIVAKGKAEPLKAWKLLSYEVEISRYTD